MLIVKSPFHTQKLVLLLVSLRSVLLAIHPVKSPQGLALDTVPRLQTHQHGLKFDVTALPFIMSTCLTFHTVHLSYCLTDWVHYYTTFSIFLLPHVLTLFLNHTSTVPSFLRLTSHPS
jgi:hypothetical protein